MQMLLDPFSLLGGGTDIFGNLRKLAHDSLASLIKLLFLQAILMWLWVSSVFQHFSRGQEKQNPHLDVAENQGYCQGYLSIVIKHY